MTSPVSILLPLVDVPTYEAWQRSLVPSKPSSDETQAAQKEREDFLRRVGLGRSETFLMLMNALDASPDRVEGSIPALPAMENTDQMLRLPRHDEQQIGKALHDKFTLVEAAEPAVWALCHAYWIRDGVFGDDILAVFALRNRDKTLEQRVRNVLRGIGGLRPIRGNITTFADSSISQAWWRYHLATICVETSHGTSEPLTLDEAFNVLMIPAVWEILTLRMLKQVTSIAEPQAYSAIVAAIAAIYPAAATTFYGANRKIEKPSKRQVGQAVYAVGRLAHKGPLAACGWDTLMNAALDGLSAHKPDTTEAEEMPQP